MGKAGDQRLPPSTALPRTYPGRLRAMGGAPHQIHREDDMADKYAALRAYLTPKPEPAWIDHGDGSKTRSPAEINEWLASLQPFGEHTHSIKALLAERDEAKEALQAILPYIPVSSASDLGAARHSEHVKAADKVRAALATLA